MNILVAPQAYKGSLSAAAVADAIRSGIYRYRPDMTTFSLPVADGGDGFLEVIMSAVSGTYRATPVRGPLDQQIAASWGVIEGGEAVIELAQICGLTMISTSDRNPRLTTTYGVGEVIRAALDEGIRHILLGIGGSGTNDGGMGLAGALGARFLDKEGKELPLRGDALRRLHEIDLSGLDPRLKDSHIVVACDVVNPFTGSDGASLVYAQQKGADAEGAEALEEGLSCFAAVVEQQYGIDLNTIEGSGAAGGAGGGLCALLGAELRIGIELVLQRIDFDRHLEKAQVVITGEGCMDGQTAYYKAPMGVATRAKGKRIPVVAIVGSLGEGYRKVHREGIDAIIPLSFRPSAMLSGEETLSLITMAAEQAIRLISSARVK